MAKQHYSDCAVHNEPAYPSGECDCGGYEEELFAPFTEAIAVRNSRIAEIEAENAKLREALEFYGWADHWTWEPNQMPVCVEDKGRRARDVLKNN